MKASVGHIRDLPSRTPKGSKQLVPGVDLEHDFAPAYEFDAAKDRTVNGTFASVASVRRSPTALLRPSGGRGSFAHEPQDAEKTKLKSRLDGRIPPAAQAAFESVSVRQRDRASRGKITSRQRR